MNQEVDNAVHLVTELYGHETAHLSPTEQVNAAAAIIRQLTETIEEITLDRFADIKGAAK